MCSISYIYRQTAWDDLPTPVFGAGHTQLGVAVVIFEASSVFKMMTCEQSPEAAVARDTDLIVRAVRLHELVKARDHHFRRSIMADSAMAVMLSLFLGELKSVSLTQSTLSLVNMLDEDEAAEVIESLIHAGLAVVTGEMSERRAVGLSPLGSARMRSFVSDFPEL